MEANQLLEQAAFKSGGIAELAKKLGLTDKAVYQWRKRGVPVAWQRVIKAEILRNTRKPSREAA